MSTPQILAGERVLDHGYVQLEEVWGSDKTGIEAARMCRRALSVTQRDLIYRIAEFDGSSLYFAGEPWRTKRSCPGATSIRAPEQ